MKTLLARGVCIAMLAALFGSTTLAQQDDKKKAPRAGQPQMTPEQQKMMEACMKAGTPGTQHKLLETLAGKWDASARFWDPAGGEPSTSKGVSERKLVFGGRYLIDDYKGEMMGAPFEGHGTWAYDNVQGKYVTTWYDSMSTGIMMDAGTYDESTKTFTMKGEYWDPMTGKKAASRTVHKLVGPNETVMEMYCPDPSGKEYRCMEITYKRAAAAASAADGKSGVAKTGG